MEKYPDLLFWHKQKYLSSSAIIGFHDSAQDILWIARYRVRSCVRDDWDCSTDAPVQSESRGHFNVTE
jgi:hypothetical protein